MAVMMGIDVATTGAKALVCDEGGKVLAVATNSYPLDSPRPGWSEQDPQAWWQATVKSISRALDESGVDPGDVVGVGMTGQMHGAVFLDKGDKVLRPAILWNDQRTAEECAEITRAVGARRLIKLVSNPALTGFTAPKIVWVRRNEPEVYEKARKILLPKDYIRFRLTGTFATDVSDASGTLLFSVAKRHWSEEMLELLDLDGELLPRAYESPEVCGSISALAAEETGLLAGTPVVAGGGDQAAGAVGNGIVKKGTLSATLGTSGVVFAFCDKLHTDPKGRVHTFCHAVPGRWHVMGVVLAAGGSFRWLRDNLGRQKQQGEASTSLSYEELTEEAARAPAGSEGLFFLPYLTGERTPHGDPYARGAWIGLTNRHGRPELIRSAMEGASFAMRDSLEIIRSMSIEVRQIRISGGGARSELWRSIQADIFNHPVVTINATEGPAFGAALLAAVGTRVFSSVEEACEATISVTSEMPVNQKNAETYERVYPLYRKLYQSLKKDFRAIAALVEG